MAALSLLSVQDYVNDVRTIILDTTAPFRYSDDSIVTALNMTLLEARRIRPDLFVCRYGNDVPQYTGNTGDEVPIEPQFRLAIEFGICAHTLLRDEEDVQDERANSFLTSFHDFLLGPRPGPVQGGTPQPKSQGR